MLFLFYNEITEDLTNSFLENVHRIIHGCFDLALENHWIRFNPNTKCYEALPLQMCLKDNHIPKNKKNLLLNFCKKMMELITYIIH